MTESTEECRLRVIQTIDDRKEFVKDQDGVVYWWPEGSTNGYLASYHLRWLADELDKRNEPWQKEIAKMEMVS